MMSLGNDEESGNKVDNSLYFINTLIKDKKFKIYCGDGRQKLRWLADCAIHKYQSLYGQDCGNAYAVKLENGNLCDLNQNINTTLKMNENVWVMLREEFEVFQEDLQKKLDNMQIEEDMALKS